MASQSVEEYLEAIYRLGGANEAVSTCDLAELLNVTPPSVTTMLRRLSRDGLVKHVRYRGISLTPDGLKAAAAMIRRHRLSERLLTDVFGMPWDRVHDAACRLEHVLTGEIEERAYTILGSPERCPHGNLLDGTEDKDLVQLSDIPAGDCAAVVKVSSEDEAFLRSVADVGLVPSAFVDIDSKVGEVVVVLLDGKRVEVSISTADRIWVHHLDRANT